VQDYLEVPFALENTSSYMTYTSSQMNEWEFISEVAERADIGLMFDVNNVYVSAFNHGFDAHEFIRSIPHERIVQIHLAGHSHLGKYIIDTHRGQVVEEVWDLYRATLRHTGSVSTLIEWDDEIPAWSVLADEAEKARRVRDEVLGRMALDPASPRPVAAERSPSPYSGGRSSGHGGPRELAADENSLLGEAVAE
jgi:uncharacterized protein (UPF0276 family)